MFWALVVVLRMFAFIADGEHGRHGINGSSGSSGYTGGDGGRGGNATASTPGLRAGDALLFFETTDTGIHISGQASGGLRDAFADTVVSPGSLGQIVMSAVGGTGGNGANGGRGGDGGTVSAKLAGCQLVFLVADLVL